MTSRTDIEIRPITDDELHQWALHTNRAFAGTPNPDRVDRLLRPNIRYEDTLAAFDGSELVATAHHEPTPLTLPGGQTLPCAGVTRVSVAPTHRRRGILRRVMETQLRQAYETGNPLAALWASETPIYGRFGYGLATIHEAWTIDRRDADFAWWAPEQRGRVRFLQLDEAREALPAMFEEYASMRPGGMIRNNYRWAGIWENDEWGSTAEKPLNIVVYESESGEREGYAGYRMKGEWPDGVPTYKLNVQECVGLTPTAEVELWRYLLNVDLVSTVNIDDRPTDSALPWLMSDIRRLKRAPRDGIYLRVLDVPRALESRTYGAEGRLTFQVNDPTCEWVDGCYALEATSDGASVTRTDEAAELVMHPAALGSMLLGTQSATVQARAGLIEERVEGALQRADALFRTDVAPLCLYHF